MLKSCDILKLGWKFPSETVYVLATGPNGNDHYKRIPDDAWVIGVNKAIEIYFRNRTPTSIWLCADGTLPEQEWFTKTVNGIIQNVAALSDNHIATPCFDSGALLKTYPDAPYYFTHGHTLRESPKFQPIEGVLRAGGSISGQAMQLAYWLGAKRIVLVGVDMTGSKYFDDTENINPRLSPDGKSLHLHLLNGLCGWLKAQGIEIVSLSETALDVKVI